MKQSSFLSRLGRAARLFAVLWLLMVSAVPQPAQATTVFDPGNYALTVSNWIREAAQWASNLLHLEEIFTSITNYMNMVNREMDQFQSFMNGSTQAEVTGIETLAKAHEQMYKAATDAAALDTKLGAMLEHTMEYAQPVHEYACKSTQGRQGVLTLENHAVEASRLAGESAMGRYRCPTCAGNAANDYGVTEYNHRCASGFGSPRDGYDASCVDTTTVGDQGQPLADADLLPPSEEQVLVMPALSHVTNGEVTVSHPNPTTPRERFYMAGVSWLHKIAGPVPSPLYGAQAMATPVGRLQRAMFNHCTASQSALLKQCSDVVAFFTRPRCEAGAADPLCAKLNAQCNAATEGLIDKTKFDNCEQGLSPYEAMLLEHSMCLPDEFYTKIGQMGANHAKMQDTTELCALVWDTWQGLINQMKGNCTKAVQAMPELKSCWKAVDDLGVGKSGNMAGLEENESGMYPASAPGAKMSESAALAHKINARKDEATERGTSFPIVVGQ